jgi:cytochrome c oxidase assembly protein subunit 15
LHQFALPKHAERSVSLWLAVVAILLIAMILLGGMTRLTDSGLSITEWKPVTGALPPLTLSGWQAEFAKYQQIPEFKLQNSAMTLGEFQAIYWWEWGHRLLGRLIGLVVIVPLVLFWIRGYLSRSLKPRLVVLFLMGGFQGFLGWWMVSSGLGGLGDLLDVSAYRLVIHLGMALLILGLTFWTFMDVRWCRGRRDWRASLSNARLSWFLLALLFGQFLLGGFVAANDGGKLANHWPLLQTSFFPETYGDLVPFWRNWFEDGLVAQFHHRIGAYIIALVTAWFVWRLRKERFPALRRLGVGVGAIILAQIGLGVWTVLAVAPMHLAVAHQFLALVSFLVVLNATHACSRYYLSS